MINLSLFSKDNDLFYWFSMEEQVISRAHRMGATRPIHVETLAMRGTIEEQMVHFLQVNQYLTVKLTVYLCVSHDMLILYGQCFVAHLCAHTDQCATCFSHIK